MNTQQNNDPSMTWVFGKVQPGWYVARWIWNKEYADHLETLGYRVMKSVTKPEVA